MFDISETRTGVRFDKESTILESKFCFNLKSETEEQHKRAQSERTPEMSRGKTLRSRVSEFVIIQSEAEETSQKFENLSLESNSASLINK